MATTGNADAGEKPAEAACGRRFVAISSRAEPAAADPGVAEPLISRRAVIGGVSMFVSALLCFGLSAGFSEGRPELSDQTAQRIFDLHERIDVAEAKAAALPQTKDAVRGLVTAQGSADQVAKLQNDYRYLTPSVTAAGGKLDPETTTSMRRSLAPHFAPSVDQATLGPWYLLASDVDVPAGVGIPMSFDSGFAWVAQRPHTINDDATVRVVWLALEARPAGGQTAAVLAWSRADYDITRKTFSNLQTSTTVAGQALRLEVPAS